MKLKKLVLGVALLFSCVVLAQEKGDFSGFAGIAYPLSSDSDLGINGGVEYMFTDEIAAAPSFTYYTTSGVTNTAINLDVRYYLGGNESLKYFGLAGVSIRNASANGVSVSDTGYGGGAGLIYAFSDSMGLIAQVRYGSSISALEPMVGLNFNF